MKKVLVFALVLSFLVPAAAFAATEFSLGGFIKLDAFWDSTQANKNLNGGWQRDNVGWQNHGRTYFTAQGSRFNFTIKGPKVFGAQVTGFLEMDFDNVQQPSSAASVATGAANWAATASNSYTPRLRHAMFRFNWPETELLFGQYWSMLCEWYPELAEDGPMQTTGAPTARLPQIRLTQKFLGWGTAAFLIGEANPVNGGESYSTVDNAGQSAFMPQIQGKLQYQQDLWGKAAFYGKPIPLTVSLVAAVQRSFVEPRPVALLTWGNNTYCNGMINTSVNHHQTLYPWIVQGNFFIPVLATHSANLAGTASILTSWYVGQGLEAFGYAGIGNFYRFDSGSRGASSYDVELQKRYGGKVQGQYYFTNEWFLTAAYGLSSQFGQDLFVRDPGARQGPLAANPQGFRYALAADLVKTYQQAEVCLWYRPVQAIKFGLEYAYGAQAWFQSTSANPNANAAPTAFVANPVNTSSNGNAHRVEFVGFFYF
jgi:hypothetical protein